MSTGSVSRDPKDPKGPKEPVAPKGLRLKPDPLLLKFGKDDELSQCVAPVPTEIDAPLDSDDDRPWSSCMKGLYHFPKNRYCDICRRAEMTGRLHRSRDKERDAEEALPLHFGHKLRADNIILGQDLTKGSEGEQACHITYDESSGCTGAFPQTHNPTQNNVAALQKFGGTRAHGKALCTVKSNCAPEVTEAVKQLGWLPEPGTPNDPYHNAQLERLIRTIKEGTRADHLKAGFPHSLWPRSIEYFCTARSFTQPVPVHPNDPPRITAYKEGKACYEAANGGQPFNGHRVPPGALVYYKPPNHKDLPAFNARTFPGIFCGWRLDSGFKFRGVHLALDYEVLRTDQQGCGRPIQVHSTELAVADTFVFQLHEASVEKLSLFRPKAELPALDTKEALQFEKGAPEPKPRQRRTYVTLERALRFGYTVRCRGCENIAEGVKHTDACHQRFGLLMENEELAKKARAAERAKGSATPKTPSFDAPAAPSFKAPPILGAWSSKDPALVPGASNAVSSAATNSSGKQAEATEEHELDYWEFDEDKLGWQRVHIKPRKRLYTPIGRSCTFNTTEISPSRGKRSGSVEAVVPTLQIIVMTKALTVESRLEAGLELLGFSPKLKSTLQKRLLIRSRPTLQSN